MAFAYGVEKMLRLQQPVSQGVLKPAVKRPALKFVLRSLPAGDSLFNI
jgi:hypothetical protein